MNIDPVNVHSYLHRIAEIDQIISDKRRTSLYKIFGQTITGIKSLKNEEISLIEHLVQDRAIDSDSLRYVSTVLQKEIDRINAKPVSRKRGEAFRFLRTLQQRGDRTLHESVKVLHIEMSDFLIVNQKNAEGEAFSQEAFSVPEYDLQVPYKGGVLACKGLGVDVDGKIMGSGGYGRVFFAAYEEASLALKLVRITSAEQLEMIKQESSFALKMDNAPHVVGTKEIIYIEEGQKTHYAIIVMEQLEQGDLFSKILESSTNSFRGRPQALSQLERIRLIKEAAIGLQQMHQIGLVHLDIKPENILLKQEKGEFKAYIADFGLTAYKGVLAITPRGTPGYCAPECFDRRSIFSPACDVFSLGVVLYETLTNGKSIFSKGSDYYLDIHRFQDPTIGYTALLNGLNGSLDTSEKLAEIITQCVRFSPSERITIDRFIQELQELEDGLSV